MRKEDIDNWFSYHAPTADTLIHYGTIREEAKQFAELFNSAVPDCADKTAAMRKLRETVMAMNLAIACYEVPSISANEAYARTARTSIS